MSTSASIIVPTRGRPDYLAVTLASIAPQAQAAEAEVLVVDDAGGDAATRQLAARFGARYVSEPGPRGLNAARNAGVRHARGELLVFVDDDVEVAPGWLAALLQAAAAAAEADVFTGPIRPRLEDHALRSCGREGPPITFLDLGPHDTDARYAWGANMAIRRAAFARAGDFDLSLENAGDEQEWQDRLRASGGGRVRYVAAAALDHRRAGDDARLRSLARGAFHRGAASRRFDAWRGDPPPLRRELLTLAGCVGHVVRYRCPAGLVLVAHSLGRLRALVPAGRARERPAGAAPPSAAAPAAEDFLSGASGTVGGSDRVIRRLRDGALDASGRVSGRSARLARAARAQPPTRRVLVLGVERPELRAVAEAARAELRGSRHNVDMLFAPPGRRGKFENLNALLAERPPEGRDWLLVMDDDVVLPHGFLDRFLFLVERFGLSLAQPAHRLGSHAAWEVTRRRPGSAVRETRFVEIGPVTAFARHTFDALLPFPPLRMGWGLDVHWAAIARERDWRIGVVDAVPVLHSVRPAAETYSRQAAIDEARAFLAGRPYVVRAEAQRTLVTHRTW